MKRVSDRGSGPPLRFCKRSPPLASCRIPVKNMNFPFSLVQQKSPACTGLAQARHTACLTGFARLSGAGLQAQEVFLRGFQQVNRPLVNQCVGGSRAVRMTAHPGRAKQLQQGCHTAGHLLTLPRAHRCVLRAHLRALLFTDDNPCGQQHLRPSFLQKRRRIRTPLLRAATLHPGTGLALNRVTALPAQALAATLDVQVALTQFCANNSRPQGQAW